MYSLNSFKKRLKYFHAEILENDNKIQLPFFKIDLIHTTLLSGDQGYILIFKLPRDDCNYERIINMEKYAIKQIVENNKEWFNNDLDEEDITKMFKSSLSGDNLVVYYSFNKPPNGKIDDFDKWVVTNKYSLPVSVTCKIKCEGLYIYPNKCLIRWIVSSIDEYNDDDEIDYMIIDSAEKIEINNYWEEQHNQYIDDKNNKIKEYLDKIEDCKNKQNASTIMLDKIKNSESINEWNAKIEEFKNMIMSNKMD